MAHTYGNRSMRDGTSGARIDQVRVLSPAGPEVPAVGAGSADGLVFERAGPLGVFDGDGPTTPRAQFTPRFDQEVGVTAALEELRRLVDGPPDGDAGKVDLERRVLLAQQAVENLEFLLSDGWQNSGDFRVRGRFGAARRWPEAPKLDEWTDGDVIRSAGLPADFCRPTRERQDRPRHRHGVGGPCAIELGEVGVGAP